MRLSNFAANQPRTEVTAAIFGDARGNSYVVNDGQSRARFSSRLSRFAGPIGRQS